MTPSPTLCVIQFSESFDQFWKDLAADLRLTLVVRAGGADAAPVAGSAAVLLAAGGAEREALQWLRAHALPARTSCLVVGADACRRVAMQFVRSGAADYFALPDDVEVLRNALAAAVAAAAPHASSSEDGTRSTAAETDAFGAIVGECTVLREQVSRATRLARHRNATALILGETGTGKELFARAIHAASPRHAGPFVPVNCSALPDNLVESELFGHERGAFTGAHVAKTGLFEIADGGTLFLDEMGSLPLALQAKLLRVLDDRQIRRVGGTKSRGVDVRVLAAANEDLEKCVREGTFREDLFYRLSGVTFRLPPLRERGEDVHLVTEAILARLAADHGVPVPLITPEVRERLEAHSWPGNVRELKNSVERALLMSTPGELFAEELVPRTQPVLNSPSPIPFPAPLSDINSAAAKATVHWCGGNRAESARRLGISPRRLRRLLAGADEEELVELPSA
ncbi:MAG: sigma 54-interacting transcriptional regulator [Gemmatimonadota bacterium]|nr:sigma 54-interacting transcriptional regulator [Gemmatimonadota bacterium]